ncbi:hypothetical protein ACPA9J_31535 [Pseudomonas aeruginosa]
MPLSHQRDIWVPPRSFRNLTSTPSSATTFTGEVDTQPWNGRCCRRRDLPGSPPAPRRTDASPCQWLDADAELGAPRRLHADRDPRPPVILAARRLPPRLLRWTPACMDLALPRDQALYVYIAHPPYRQRRLGPQLFLSRSRRLFRKLGEPQLQMTTLLLRSSRPTTTPVRTVPARRPSLARQALEGLEPASSPAGARATPPLAQADLLLTPAPMRSAIVANPRPSCFLSAARGAGPGADPPERRRGPRRAGA